MAVIIVDGDLCTRCGICTTICPANIVESVDEKKLPKVSDEKAGLCFSCGHCEAFCPLDALTMNIRTDERAKLPKGAGLKIPSRRSSRVRIPYPALLLSVLASDSCRFFLHVTGFFFSAASRMMENVQEKTGCKLEETGRQGRLQTCIKAV